MSVVAISVTVLLLSMHACNARHTPGGFGIHNNNNKDVVTAKTKLQHDLDTIMFPISEITNEIFPGDGNKSVTTSHESRSPIEIQGLERSERSMVESETHETKEATDANEEEPVEDAVVMDYVTPHRKSPIHNHH